MTEFYVGGLATQLEIRHRILCAQTFCWGRDNVTLQYYEDFFDTLETFNEE